MFKARNIIITFCISYLLLIATSFFFESAALTKKGANIQAMVQTAADMSLEQAQATDDFFVDVGYATGGGYDIMLPTISGDAFAPVPMYEAVTGMTTREDIFKYLYDTTDFRQWAKDTSGVTTQMAYLNSTGNIVWCRVPKIIRFGVDYLDTSSFGNVKQLNSNIETTSRISGVSVIDVANLYNFNSPKQTTSVGDYYLTPISLGMTYFNPTVLGRLFSANMDLLMRAKVIDSSRDISEYEGVLTSGYYNQLVDVSTFRSGRGNPVNDGTFTFLRGDSHTVMTSTGQTCSVYDGVAPKIEYKVIDMYNKSNNSDVEDMVKHAFGRSSDYLKSKNTNKLYNNGSSITSNPCVVAKVTFYAPIIVPYSTSIAREFRTMSEPGLQTRYLNNFTSGINNNGTRNFANVKFDATHTGLTDSPKYNEFCIEYTTYFAVAP